MKTHTFMGMKYDISLGEMDGACDPPTHVGSPSLYINISETETLKFLETVIHESLHACHFSAQEERIERTARDVSRFLWRLGYRKQEKSND